MDEKIFTLESGVRLLKGMVLFRETSTIQLQEGHISFELTPERRGKVENLQYDSVAGVEVQKNVSIFFALIGGACLFWSLIGFLGGDPATGVIGLLIAAFFLWRCLMARLIIRRKNSDEIKLKSFSVSDAVEAGTAIVEKAGISEGCKTSFPMAEVVKLIVVLLAGFILPFFGY